MSQNISRPQLAWFFICAVLLWCVVAASCVLLIQCFSLAYAYADDADEDKNGVEPLPTDVAAPPADLNQQERRSTTVGEEDPLNLHLAYNFRVKQGMQHTVQAAWFSTNLFSFEFFADVQEDKFNDDTRKNAGPMFGLNYVFGNKIRTLAFLLGGLTSGEELTWQTHAGSRTFSPEGSISLATDFIVRGDEFLDFRAEVNVEFDVTFIKFEGWYWDFGYQFLHLPAQNFPRFNLGVSFMLFPWLFDDPARVRLNTIVGDGSAGLWTGFEYTF